MSNADEVIEALEYLSEDEDVPKSVLVKVNEIITDLRKSDELSIAINRATNTLEELSEDVNLPPFVKTQIWGVMSQLAALESDMSD